MAVPIIIGTAVETRIFAIFPTLSGRLLPLERLLTASITAGLIAIYVITTTISPANAPIPVAAVPPAAPSATLFPTKIHASRTLKTALKTCSTIWLIAVGAILFIP